MKVWMFSLALALAASLVQVDQAMSKPTDSYAAPKKPPSAKKETVAKPAMVTIEGFQFQPDNVTIKKGGKVTIKIPLPIPLAQMKGLNLQALVGWNKIHPKRLCSIP
jgi:hypothetical protein